MSNSRKKTKIFGHACTSEKDDKRINNRMFRRKQQVISGEILQENNSYIKYIWSEDNESIDTEKLYPINMNEIRSTWSMSKDGKEYYLNASDKMMRK